MSSFVCLHRSVTRRVIVGTSSYQTSFPQAKNWFSSKSTSNENDNDDDDDDITDWIPPQRPLSGDKSHPTSQDSKGDQPDWLQTRRQAIAMQKPTKTPKFHDAELEIIPNTLLSTAEIQGCLLAMGGIDVQLYETPVNKMVIATATSIPHLNLLTETLVRQLKQRNLADNGVVGAMLGSEGMKDDSWRVVDCANHVVHLQIEETRQAVNLEALWNGTDAMLHLNLMNESEVEDYIQQNPAPREFGTSGLHYGSSMSGVMSQLQKWNLKHKSVVPDRPRRKHGNRKKGRMRRRNGPH